ncbi:unnamed protein product [Moneuplotes crassus]|uniref:Uncharacterized protein n=1 Tax=Euplotes crassus TaxID=5936 RepID=A0AAD1XAF8_EUPCR|nr:unnamed protein product [Moneuplotes crassus]
MEKEGRVKVFIVVLLIMNETTILLQFPESSTPKCQFSRLTPSKLSNFYYNKTMQQGEDQNGSLANVDPHALSEVNDSLFSTSKVLTKKPIRKSEKVVKDLNISFTQKTLKSAFEKEFKKRKKEFKKRYDYYLKIKKALKIVKASQPDIDDLSKKELLGELRLNQTLSQKKKVDLEIDNENYKYKISILRENKKHDMEHLHENPGSSFTARANVSSIKLPKEDLISSMKEYKDKYKKLMALKAKNDEKLQKAKRNLEALKNKNGMDLIKELNLGPKRRKDSIADLLEKKREMAMNGDFKLPKMRNYTKRNFIPAQNISTVEEEEDCEEFESSGKSRDYINLTRDALKKMDGSKPERTRQTIAHINFTTEENKACTKDNLQKMNLKQNRQTFHGSLVGNLMNSYKNPGAVHSQINFKTSGVTSCGKLFMLADRLSFAGTSSVIGHSFSTIGSVFSSISGSRSNLISETEE